MTFLALISGFAAHVEGVETGPEIAVHRLVAKTQGVPVEAHLALALGDFQQLDIA